MIASEVEEGQENMESWRPNTANIFRRKWYSESNASGKSDTMRREVTTGIIKAEVLDNSDKFSEVMEMKV